MATRFQDLRFQPRDPMIGPTPVIAEAKFVNGFSAFVEPVLLGEGVVEEDRFQVQVWHRGRLVYDVPFVDDLMGSTNAAGVTALLVKIEKLPLRASA